VARICLIRQGHYPLDPRIRSEVDILVAAGHEVDVICLRRPGEPNFERRGAVTVRRLPVPRKRGNAARYLGQYVAFAVGAGILAGGLHLRRRYRLVQVNTIPDTLVFAALLPKLLGARVLIDLHECMPEFVASKFGLRPGQPAVRLVAWLEQISIRFADFALTCTEPMRQVFIRRGAPADKIGIVMNSYGLNYGQNAAVRTPWAPAIRDSFVLICHGSIEERYGLDTLLRAVAMVRDQIPEIRVEIFGDGSYRQMLGSLINELRLEDKVYLSPGWVPMEDLLRAIASADVGVVAMKRDAFRDLVLCTKMFDFIGMGKPTIVSRTAAMEEYFDESCFEMFVADDPQDLARAILRLYADPSRRRKMADRARLVSEPYSWSLQSARYLSVIESLSNRRSVPAAEPVTATRDSEAAAS
jgi:glycosyltransferase involved in cell wall biosynthesis